MIEAVKKIYDKVCSSFFLLISHPVSKKTFIILVENQSMRIGRDQDNDLVLQSAQSRPHEGVISWQGKKLCLVGCDHQRKVIGWKPLAITGYRLRAVKSIYVGCAVMGFLGLLLSTLHADEAVPLVEQQQYALPARDTYGNLMDKKTFVDELSYTFILTDVVAKTLLFTPGNIAGERGLVLLLNGHKLQEIAPCLKRWDRQRRIVLDQKYLRQGSNTLTFEYLGDPDHPWGLRNLYVQNTAPTRMRSTQELFSIAQKLFIERNAKVGNLLRAKKIMQKLRARFAQDSALPQAYQDLMKWIETELGNLQQRYLRDARILVRNERHDQAKFYYQKLLGELIDPMDPLRIQVQQEMMEAGM